MKLGVVGAGGAGGYFATRWCEAGLDVTLLARGRHYRAVARDGLRLRSPLGDAHVHPRTESDPAALEAVDLVVFATKSWQLPEAVSAVAPHLGSNTMAFGLQNGIGSAEVLSRHISVENVLGATCRIFSFIEEPGVIHHAGMEPMILFGELHGGVSDRARRLESRLDVGPTLRVIASHEVNVELWRKLLFFAPISGVGSLTRSPIGVLRSVSESRTVLELAVREVAAVARAKGIPLEEDASERALAFIDTLPEDGTSSMHRDFEAGRPTELEALSGAVARLGRDLGVPTPTHDFIYSSLVPLELEAKGVPEDSRAV